MHLGKPPSRPRQWRDVEPALLADPAGAPSHHFVKATVRVHEYPDRQLAIFDGPSCLARFDCNGTPIDVSRAA